MINYYSELNLDMSLSDDELEKEIKVLQKKWMNRSNSANQDKRHEAEKKIQLLSEAKEILTNYEKKQQYNLQLKKHNTDSSLNTNSGPQESTAQLSEEEFKQKKSAILKLLNLKDYPTAITHGQQLTSLAPGNKDSWYLYGLTNRLFGNYDLAISHFNKALELDPTHGLSYLQLGHVYNTINQKKQAFSYYDRALKLNPNSIDCHRNMGVLLRDNGEYDEAFEHFTKLFELDPSEDSKQYMADIYFCKGRSVLYSDENNYYYYEEDKITYFIEMLTKSKEYSDDPFYDNEIQRATKASAKTYDWSKITLLTLPLFVIGGSEFLAFILLCAIIYFSIRPRWEINRRKNHGINMPFDTFAGFYTKSIGFFLVFMFSIIVAFIGISINTNDWT